MKILVIGGTRFLGYHIVRQLLADGHQVTLFNRGLTPDDFGSAVGRIHGDRTNPREFRARLRGSDYDVVIDMIAYRGAESQQAVAVFAGRVGHFIHISTGSVYVVTRDYPCPLREEDFDRELIPRPERRDEWWLYGVQKRDCELILRKAYEEQNFPVTVFRLPIVMGERDYTLRAYSYFIRIADGGPLLLPDAGMNVFTHIYQGDIVATLTRNLLNPKTFGQAYNLAMEEIVSLRAFVQKAAEIMERQVEIIDVPSRWLEKLSPGTTISPFTSRRPFVLAVDKARQELGFRSTPFPLWLEKTIRWFFTEYKGGPPENYRWRPLERELARRFVAHRDALIEEIISREVKNG